VIANAHSAPTLSNIKIILKGGEKVEPQIHALALILAPISGFSSSRGSDVYDKERNEYK
jgi:hypothetical protein